MDPQQQMLVAEMMRRQQAMQGANSNANRFSNMAAIAQMANNLGVAQAADMMNRQAQSQYKPISILRLF